MGYITNNLIRDEQIVFVTKFHWWMWASNILITIVLLLIFNSILSSVGGVHSTVRNGATSVSVDPGYALLALFVPLICIFGIGRTVVDFIAWTTSEVGVTNQRIMVKRGLILRRVAEMSLVQFEACQLSESLFGRLLGYKTITLQGTGGTKFRYTLVPKASEFRNRIVELVSMNSRSRQQYYAQANQQIYNDPLADLPPDNPTTMLRQVADLIKAGRKQESAQIVKGLTQSHPNSADVWYLVGYLQTDPAKKRASYQRALSINPNHKQSQAALASIG